MPKRGKGRQKKKRIEPMPNPFLLSHNDNVCYLVRRFGFAVCAVFALFAFFVPNRPR